MKRKVVLGLLLTSVLLSGCGSSDDIAKLNNLKALNSESTVTTYNMSTTEKEAAVYAQVVARQLLDLTTLDACTDNEKQQVLQFMNNVDSQLCGVLQSKDGVIDEAYTNYLLMEFEKTPYYWQRSKTTIRGIDAESRSIVVDVTYKTLDFKKDVQGDSYLVQGEPNYDKKMEVRYSRWLQILETKYNSGDASWESELQKFTEVYGNPEDIFASQRNVSLTDSVYETGNQKTYTGLTDSKEEDTGATMVIRYVLTPSYTLGINTGMQCSHMYRVSYTVDKDCTEKMKLFKDEGYATISDNIYELLYSYFNCMDESDYNGLYKLTKNFERHDKYFSDYFDTTYRKHEGFTVSLFDISGTKVKCGVSVSNKVRAKGSDMAFPIYTDRYYVQMELVDDTLKVTNLQLLSSAIEGEPAISTKDAQTSGFVSSIDLDNQDKKDIEGLISNFGALQLLKDTSSDDFGALVDTSMGQNQLAELKKNMTSLIGEKKVTWLTNYMQGTSNYASVRCREQFQKKDNSIIESDITYNFINKGNRWYIYSYDINSTVKLDTTNLTTTSSLCVCSAGKVDALTSQIVNTDGVQSGNSLENIGTTYEHDAYTPVLKNGTQEQGLAKKTASDLSDKELKDLYNQMATNYSGTDEYFLAEYSELKGKLDGVSEDVLKDAVCLYYNYINNRYSNLKEFTDAQDSVEEAIRGILEEEKDDKSVLGSTFKALNSIVVGMEWGQ